MNRLRQPWVEPIRRALEVAPLRVDTDWFTTEDPVFAGIHHYDDTVDGRSHRDTAHTCYPWHIDGPADRRQTTIVLPGNPDVGYIDYPAGAVGVIVHEIGHVVDYRFGFSRLMTPVSEYAETNRAEAFAEAFTKWLLPEWDGDLLTVDDHEWLDQIVGARWRR
jgi:hypothetical protein